MVMRLMRGYLSAMRSLNSRTSSLQQKRVMQPEMSSNQDLKQSQMLGEIGPKVGSKTGQNRSKMLPDRLLKLGSVGPRIGPNRTQFGSQSWLQQAQLRAQSVGCKQKLGHHLVRPQERPTVCCLHSATIPKK